MQNRNPLTLKRYNELLDAEVVKAQVKTLLIKEQYQNEKDFIAQNENLIENINVFNFYRRLKNFDIRRFFEINREQFYTPDNVDFFNYFTKAVLYSSRRNYRFYRRIRYWLEDLQSISKGAYGSTYSAKIRDSGSDEKAQRLFLLKFDKKGEKEIYLHEYFIGNFFMSRLRKYCPNFSMIFGLVKCSMPDSIFGFGREYKKISCLIYEYIYPAITFAKFLKSCSTDAFMSMFLQMVFALRIAAEKLGFTHNDLHAGNIMVKELDKQTLIPYEYKGKKLYVYTRNMAVVIDYGFSRIEIKSKKFGPYGMPYISLNSYEKCYTIKDIFAIVLDSGRIAGNSGNTSCFELIHKIMTGFFISGIRSPTRYDKIMDRTWHYPLLPHLEGVKGVEMFIDWLFENFKEQVDRVIFTEEEVLRLHNKEDYFIFDCDITGCLTLDEIYEEIYKKKPIDDIFYYYDIFQYNPNVKPTKTVIDKTAEVIKTSFSEIQKKLLSLEELEAKTPPEAIKRTNYERTIEVYLKIRDLNETIKVLKVFTPVQQKVIEKLFDIKVRINGILRRLYRKKITAFVKGRSEEVKDYIIPSFIL